VEGGEVVIRLQNSFISTSLRRVCPGGVSTIGGVCPAGSWFAITSSRFCAMVSWVVGLFVMTCSMTSSTWSSSLLCSSLVGQGQGVLSSTIHCTTSWSKAVQGSSRSEVEGVEGEDMAIELMEILVDFLVLLLSEDGFSPSLPIRVIGKPWVCFPDLEASCVPGPVSE